MLINCVAYQDGRKLADIAGRRHQRLRAAARMLRLGRAARRHRRRAARRCSSEFGLHELAVEDARHGHQRPKIEEYGDTLFVVHAVGRARARSMSCSVGEVDDLRRPQLRALGAQPQPAALPRRARALRARAASCCSHGAGFVLYALMDAVVDRYFPISTRSRPSSRTSRRRSSSAARRAGTSSSLYALKRRATVLRARRRRRCWRWPASCTAAACRRCAPARRSTSATSTTTWRASTPRSTRCATRSAPRSRSTCRW